MRTYHLGCAGKIKIVPKRTYYGMLNLSQSVSSTVNVLWQQTVIGDGQLMCFCAALPLANSLDLLATHDPDADDDAEEDTPIYEKFDPLLHRDRGRSKK